MTANRVDSNSEGKTTRPVIHYVLWFFQGLLAFLFLFGGGFKLIMPVQQLADQTHLNGWFMKFIGLSELSGGFGLVLPSLLRIKPFLTPLAAAGLTIITIGATVISAQMVSVPAAVFPLVTCLLCAFVCYGRWQMAPIEAKS